MGAGWAQAAWGVPVSWVGARGHQASLRGGPEVGLGGRGDQTSGWRLAWRQSQGRRRKARRVNCKSGDKCSDQGREGGLGHEATLPGLDCPGVSVPWSRAPGHRGKVTSFRDPGGRCHSQQSQLSNGEVSGGCPGGRARALRGVGGAALTSRHTPAPGAQGPAV